MIFNKNKGITLIALIITVVILLILAAVSVVALRDTSLFDRTQRATQVYNESRLDEEEKLTGYEYAIKEHTAGVATANKLKDSKYLLMSIESNADFSAATITVTKKENTDIDLTNFKIIMKQGTGADFDFSADDNWEETNTITVNQSNTLVCAALYDGTKYASVVTEYIDNDKVDEAAPTATFAELKNSDNVLFGVSSVVTASDLGSGVNYSASKYVFNNSADPLGENADLYTDGTLTGETTTAEQSKCSKPGTATFYLHVLMVDNIGNKQEQISTGKSLTIASNKLYSYTGSAQPTQITKGTYKLEVWGAQGGIKGNNNADASSSCRGGYTYGNITIKQKQNMYVYVGGQGKSGRGVVEWINGGFNGGGKVYNKNVWGNYTNSGGGGTDIRLVTDSLYNRIIVAGGGGGYVNQYNNNQYNSYSYGYGGGSMGCQPFGGNGDPGTSYSSYYYKPATSGWNVYGETSYMALPSFGQGGYQNSTGFSYGMSGGGGGWYGGLAINSHDCGGGGTGWINTSGWYNTWKSNTPADANQYAFKDNADYYLTSANCYGGNQSTLQPSGSNEYGHAGNGYARITNLNS